ncbi:hypothetical protein BBJ28_00016413 [Nothophytophthora sp. Chile5]|nr:hypothetical protein BBJ28_00016413 [Nothophytophthora sp. Chile5]
MRPQYPVSSESASRQHFAYTAQHSQPAPFAMGNAAAKLVEAAEAGCLEEVAKAIKNGQSLDKTFNDRTPLMGAASNGHVEVVQLLLDHEADVHAADHLHRTALAHAAGQGHLQVALVLLEHGADVEGSPDTTATPLVEAALGGHTKVVQLLLNNNAVVDLDAETPQVSTALSVTAFQSTTDTARVLLDHGALVDALDSTGNTALMRAAQQGNRKLVKLLLERNADGSTRNPGGETAVGFAKAHGEDEIVAMLLEHQRKKKAWNLYNPADDTWMTAVTA